MKNSVIPFIIFLFLISCSSDSQYNEVKEIEPSVGKLAGDYLSEEGYIEETINEDFSYIDEISLTATDNANWNANGIGNSDYAGTTAKLTNNSHRKETAQKSQFSNKIIMTAHLRADVKDYNKTYAYIKKFVNNAGGYISSENEEKTPYFINNNLIIKVPSGYFPTLIDSIEKRIPNLLEKRINAQDVTASFYDLQTRIKTKKKVEERYLSILTKAKTIEEILDVEHKIGQIREQIESAEGKLKVMTNLLSFSTIHLTITENYEFDSVKYDEPTFFNKIGKGFSAGWDGILAVIIGLAYLWPMVIIGFGVFLIIRKLSKRNAERKLKK